MFSSLFLFYGLVTAKKFTQIGLKEDCLSYANSPYASNGHLSLLPKVSLKDAAVICVQWCSQTPQCNAAIAYWHETQPACFLSPQRLLGFVQDNESITKFEISEKVAREQWQSSPPDGAVASLGRGGKKIISQSIRDKKYYAYNVFFPSCPKRHNSYPSRSPVEGLGLICDINRFGSLENFDRAWTSLGSRNSPLLNFWYTFRDAILYSFLRLKGSGVPTLLVGKSLWQKRDIVQMVRRILNKEPLDPSMVYAHAAATFHRNAFFSVSPETITVDEIKQQKDHIHLIHQPFHLPDGNWVVLKWEILRSPTVATVGLNSDSVLDIPVVREFLQKASIALDKEMPHRVSSSMAYTKCVGSDEAFCTLFLDSLPDSEEFSEYFNIEIPDDFRLWIALDFMQRFGLTAEDIDAIGVTADFRGDVDFTFQS